MKRRWLQIALIIVGAAVVLGHLVALAFLGMTTSNWLSGTVIGLVLAVVGGAHLLLARSVEGSDSRWQQVGFGLLALAIGIAEGLVAARVGDARWWLIVPWALTVLAIGMFLPGPPVEKAARLAAFGFSSALMFTTSTSSSAGVSGFLVALGWSLAAAMGAIAVGAIAHAVMGRIHAEPTEVHEPA